MDINQQQVVVKQGGNSASSEIEDRMMASSATSAENCKGKGEDGVYLAAVEGGGTTFVVSVARVITDNNSSGDDNMNILQIGPTSLQILQTTTIPPKHTESGEILNYTPAQILEETCTFLQTNLPNCGHYSALGIATFGPAGVDSTQVNSYGTILNGSPKKEWRGVDLLTPIRKACGLDSEGMECRVGFDTDVNAPALAEFRHRCYLRDQKQSQNQNEQTSQSSSKPLTSLSYITVGTGVGVGLILNSKPIHGLLHPEGGHVAIQPLPNDTFTEGYSWGKERSPYEGVNTVEGMASSVALTERYLQMEEAERNNKNPLGFLNPNNKRRDMKDSNHASTREILSTLPDSHSIWGHASNAIANLCVSLLLLTSCQKIVLGGGIMKRTILYDMVRKRVIEILNGYLDSVDELSDVKKLEDVIVPSSWEDMGSGLVGAFALALDAYESNAGDGGEEEAKQSTAEKKEEEDDDKQFTLGMLAGIGLSFGCVLLTSLLGRGLHRRH